jgi:hypothetical protein
MEVSLQHLPGRTEDKNENLQARSTGVLDDI